MPESDQPKDSVSDPTSISIEDLRFVLDTSEKDGTPVSSFPLLDFYVGLVAFGPEGRGESLHTCLQVTTIEGLTSFSLSQKQAYALGVRVLQHALLITEECAEDPNEDLTKAFGLIGQALGSAFG
jgi:hypothetical protein